MIFINNTPYTYLIGWTKLDVWYYGRRTAKNCHPNEFWETYFTSSIEVDKFRQLHGEPDIRQIRQVFTDLDYQTRITKCVNWEVAVIDKIGAVKSTRWLNGHGSKFDTTGTLWWNNGTENKCSAESPGQDWQLGMIVIPMTWWNDGVNETKATKSPGPNWKAGKIIGKKTWNNGVTECRSFNQPGAEWQLGRLDTDGRQRSKKAFAGYWWNNGTTNQKTYACPGPEWIAGMLSTGAVLWNNGVIRKRSITQPGPEWILGDIPEYRKGTHWWNNGIKQAMSKVCPGSEWTRGRLVK